MELTHGHQRRDLIYIDNAVKAYLKLVDYGNSEDFELEEFGIWTGLSMQVRDFVGQIKLISGSQTRQGYGDIPYRYDEFSPQQQRISASSALTVKHL